MPTVEWISKDAAAAQLGLSVRRVQDFAKEGRIKSKLERNPGTGHKTLVLHAGDVAAYHERQDHASNLPAPQRGNGASTRTDGADDIARIALHGLMQAVTKPVSAERQPDWLNLTQAAGYSGLPVSFLRSLIDSGRLAAFDTGPRPGGRYRLAKRDLDAITAPRATGQQREIERIP